MTGPPYPPSPTSGTNAQGQFVINVSPTGDIPPFDVWVTIISQYANSPILTALCTNMAQYVDMTKNFSDFFDNVWNILTAVGYGLDVWGRILGIGRVLELPAPSGPYLGFDEAGTPLLLTPFGQAPFYDGETTTNNFSLSDPVYRTLLLAKALANICDGSIPAVNQLLLNLFPGAGNAYVADGLNLTETFTFKFAPTAVQLAIMNSGVIPRTSGVAASISHL